MRRFKAFLSRLSRPTLKPFVVIAAGAVFVMVGYAAAPQGIKNAATSFLDVAPAAAHVRTYYAGNPPQGPYAEQPWTNNHHGNVAVHVFPRVMDGIKAWVTPGNCHTANPIVNNNFSDADYTNKDGNAYINRCTSYDNSGNFQPQDIHVEQWKQYDGQWWFTNDPTRFNKNVQNNPDFDFSYYNKSCEGNGNINLTLYYSYVGVRPPYECQPASGTRGVALMDRIHKPRQDEALSFAYAPSEYIVASSNPQFMFEMMGGRYKASDTGWPTDIKDPHAINDNTEDANPVPSDRSRYAANLVGRAAQQYFEVYQLSSGGPGDGTLLGRINTLDPYTFPTIDVDPANAYCPSQIAGLQDGCWRSFYADTAGGNITLGGAAQWDWFNGDSNRFAPVNASMKFRGVNYPNLNGMYVFLVKSVVAEDLSHGYIPAIWGFNGSNTNERGCVINQPFNGNVACPKVLKSQFPDGAILRNGYYLRAPHWLNGAQQYIATSTSSISTQINGGQNLGGGNPLKKDGKDYEARYNQSFWSLQFSAAGSSCEGTLKAQQYGFLLWNSDWDRVGKLANDSDISATIGSPWGGWGASTNSISNDFANQQSAINLNSPGWGPPGSGWTNPTVWPWQANEEQSGYVGIHNWDLGQGLAIGGPNFTYGGYPSCYRPKIAGWGGYQDPTGDSWQNSIFSTPKITSVQANPYQVHNGVGTYLYNGSDAKTAIGNQVDSRVRFGYEMSLPINTQNVAQAYNYLKKNVFTVVEIRDPNGNLVQSQPFYQFSVPMNGNQSQYSTPDVQTSMLQPNVTYRWRVCGTGADINYAGLAAPARTDRFWNCSNQDGSWGTPFRVNSGPTATVSDTITDANGTKTHWRCGLMSITLNDPEGHNVQPRLRLAWTDKNGTSNVVESNTTALRPSGSTFTTREVKPETWTVTSGGFTSKKTVPNKSFERFIIEDIPTNVQISFTARGVDGHGASDVNSGTKVIENGPFSSFSNTTNPLIGLEYGPSVLQQPETVRKWGPANNITLLTAPDFDNPPSTKEFYDLKGQKVPYDAVTDGQTFEVRLTLKNSGQTPMKRYGFADYIGSVRDFEDPIAGTFSIAYNGEPSRAIGASKMRQRIDRVIADDKNGNDDKDEDLANPNDDRQASYKMDFGDNFTPGGPGIFRAGNLNPGEYITIRYLVRANRNRTTTGPFDPEANYARRFEVGQAPTPAPAPNQRTEGGQVDISDAHVFAQYQQFYCDDTEPLFGDIIEFQPGDIVAPWLGTRRGSIHSNSNVFGYDGQGFNATYTVTSNGSINHFTGASDTIQDYDPSGAIQTGPCNNTLTPSEGIDWRREMVKNINELRAGPVNNNNLKANLFNPGSGSNKYGNLNGQQGNVWVLGSPESRENLEINQPINFKGVGTVVIFGDLIINADMGYSADSGSVNSVGFIVLGNVQINSADYVAAGTNPLPIQKMVGTYYVSDVDFAGNRPIDPATNCPNINSSYGTVATDRTPIQLRVDGLMVARSFDFLRYYIDGSDTVSDPAENIYYDGRVIANTPPGFTTFRNTSAWYEVAP